MELRIFLLANPNYATVTFLPFSSEQFSDLRGRFAVAAYAGSSLDLILAMWMSGKKKKNKEKANTQNAEWGWQKRDFTGP